MTDFKCEHCGAICRDSERGYISGCEHYPPDQIPLRGFGASLDFESGTSVKWYMDKYGQKRFVHNDNMVITP